MPAKLKELNSSEQGNYRVGR